MILILSNDGDVSCDLVQNWLEHYRYPFLRFNSWEFLHKSIQVSLVGGSIEITIDDRLVPLDSINAIWYRKYGLFRCTENYKKLCASRKLNEELINHLCKEYTKVIEAFVYSLRDRNWLTDPRYININKMEALKIAADCGFKTAPTYLVNTKSQLSSLLESRRLISKSVLDPVIASWGDHNKAMMYTTELHKKDLISLPCSFHPSMVQEMIPKEYELRIFYINGKMYPMAIFSQKDIKTSLDFRCYNWDKPNRTEPCKLDAQMKVKISRLMKKLHLNTGSIDLIKSTDGSIYFLEVNPTGQFGMVDFPCNYGLHKIVAEELIEMDINGKENQTI